MEFDVAICGHQVDQVESVLRSQMAIKDKCSGIGYVLQRILRFPKPQRLSVVRRMRGVCPDWLRTIGMQLRMFFSVSRIWLSIAMEDELVKFETRTRP